MASPSNEKREQILLLSSLSTQNNCKIKSAVTQEPLILRKVCFHDATQNTSLCEEENSGGRKREPYLLYSYHEMTMFKTLFNLGKKKKNID